MTTVAIYGASDDLIEVDGTITGADEYSAASGHGSFVIVAPNGDTARAYVDYRDSGCWTVTLGRYDEDYALPDWNARIVADDDLCRYSTTLLIDVPEGTVITFDGANDND